MWAKKLVSPEERSYYDNHLDTLSVQSKLKDSVTLESGCRTWNRLLLGCNPGQMSFILCAASDTLPTSVNLKRWHIQCGARCSLCSCTQPTTAHVLGGCPTSGGYFTYRCNQVLQCLTAELKKLLSTAGIVSDLPDLRASDSPQATIPPTILVTSYRPDIFLCSGNNKVALLEQTCPLDSVEHLTSARVRKQEKRVSRVAIRI